jgi:hypothetical protein
MLIADFAKFQVPLLLFLNLIHTELICEVARFPAFE